MSESRFLRDRHNINTLPMFLMYYDGKLCYASNTLNGYGTSRDDLLAQARRRPPRPRKTRARLQRPTSARTGLVLPLLPPASVPPTPRPSQVAASRMDAQRGAFLPPDFRFGATDNKLTASFTETLTKTSTKLGA
jgi:hypothetical protein